MCNWSYEVRNTFEEAVKLLVKDGVRFDTLIVRDMMRGMVAKNWKPSTGSILPPDISYGDVFSELWHFYRKGSFPKKYIIATKKVLAANGGIDTTIQYLPAKVWLTEPSCEDLRREDEKVKRAARKRTQKIV